MDLDKLTRRFGFGFKPIFVASNLAPLAHLSVKFHHIKKWSKVTQNHHILLFTKIARYTWYEGKNSTEISCCKYHFSDVFEAILTTVLAL